MAKDDRTFEEKVEDAEAAFYARVKALGFHHDDDIPMESWENAWSAEVYQEYANDLVRWEVALATLNGLANEAGI